MKCHLPGTDERAEVLIKVNGTTSEEYAIPHDAPPSDHSLFCWIPVGSGDRVTISCKLSGTIWCAAFDVLSAGALVAGKRLDGPSPGQKESKAIKRKFEITKVFDQVRNSKSTSLTVIEGNLQVTPLQVDLSTSDSVEPPPNALAILSVVVSLNRQPGEEYPSPYTSVLGGASFTRSKLETSPSGVSPTFGLKVVPSNTQLPSSLQNKHLRHLQQARPGKRPWATFQFHFCSKEDILASDCLQRTSESFALRSGAPQTILHDSPQKVHWSDNTLTIRPLTEQTEAIEWDQLFFRSIGEDALSLDSLFSSPIQAQPVSTESQRRAEQATDSDMQKYKKRLFGQALPSTSDGSSPRQPANTPSLDSRHMPVGDHGGERSKSDAPSAEQPKLVGSGEKAKSLSRSPATIPVATVAKTGGGTPPKHHQPARLDRPDTTSLRGAAAPGVTAVAMSRQSSEIAREQNRPAAETLARQLTSNGLRQQSAVISAKAREEQQQHIPANVSCSSFVKTETEVDHAPLTSNVTTVSNTPGCATPNTAKNLAELASNPSDESRTGNGRPSTQRHDPTGVRPTQSPVPSPGSLKHSLSSGVTTRESTPNKKSRLSELEAKKADMRKQLEQKRQRKALAQQALVEQQRLREEAERFREAKELREIEELAELLAEEDAEYEELVSARKEAERETEAARKANEEAKASSRLTEEA